MRITVLAVLSVLMLAGCESESQGEKLDRIEKQTGVKQSPIPGQGGWMSTIVHEVELPDGKTVLCVIYEGDRAGGISCDWSGHRGNSKFN